ncbi:MAG: hypothetical protein A3F68_06265 [Acidobacteria bacterium RIFCSPLOWO2_12_FULL_54_10]|nr:MAG: hypothetical protein A3F68_06265 [Acidobacteria bacterium RIFCSPLOWO2_12_FULL_54_10]
MPTRIETLTAVTRIFDSSTFRLGKPVAATAWSGIYQALLWYEAVTSIPGRIGLPHIIDANRLTYPLSTKGELRIWQARAVAVEKYMADQWEVDPTRIAGMVDKLMKLSAYAGLQRHNILGSAFAGLVKHALYLFGSQNVTYELEVAGDNAFPGVQLPTRTGEPFIDILVRKQGRNRGIISTKWSIRHDRINDLTSECRAYKNAARFTDTQIFYYVATNEYDPARVEKPLTDKCIDGVVHVHKPLVTEVSGLDGRLAEFLDLSELIEQSNQW